MARKLAGILVELAEKTDSRALVIGLGLNIKISSAERSKVDQPLTDSETLGIRLSRSELVCVLVRSMRSYLEKFLKQGFNPMVASYSQFLAYRNRFCCLQVGEKVLAEGILEGVNEKGELLLRSGRGLSSYGVGEISLRPGDALV
jgi:Biotin-(acetyl-CoA carboxylase) ligase